MIETKKNQILEFWELSTNFGFFPLLSTVVRSINFIEFSFFVFYLKIAAV